MQIKLSSRCRPPDCVDWEDCGRRTEDCSRPMSSVQRLALLAPKERSPRPTLTIVSQPASQSGRESGSQGTGWMIDDRVCVWLKAIGGTVTWSELVMVMGAFAGRADYAESPSLSLSSHTTIGFPSLPSSFFFLLLFFSHCLAVLFRRLFGSFSEWGAQRKFIARQLLRWRDLSMGI